jgi:hypothetical protein
VDVLVRELDGRDAVEIARKPGRGARA